MNMKSLAVNFCERNEIIADAITDDEALALEIQRLNLARLRYKIRATLRGNENREFLMKHL